MSLRWSSYVTPKLPPRKGARKRKNGHFPSKIALRLKKVCYKVSFCEYCHQRQSCKAFIGSTIRAQNDWWGTSHSIWNFGSNWPRWSEIADFRSIFARSASAVTPSEKGQLTLIESPLRAFQWAQNEHRTLSLSPASGAQTRSVQNLNNKLR